jgi:hypothetical protein
MQKIAGCLWKIRTQPESLFVANYSCFYMSTAEKKYIVKYLYHSQKKGYQKLEVYISTTLD